MEVFGTTDERAISLIILDKGEVQVSDKERKVELETLFKDVATVLVEKCVNPQTRRPYTMGVIERALKDVHFAVDPKRSAKAQALEILPRLQERFPIERAQMRLRLAVAQSFLQQILGQLKEWNAHVEARDLEGDLVAVTCLVDPGIFRQLDKTIHEEFNGRLEVLSVAASVAGADDPAMILDAGPSAAAQEAAALARAMEGANMLGSSARPLGVPGAASSMAMAGGHVHAPPVAHARRPAATGEGAGPASAPTYEVVYPRGPIGALPEEHSARRDRFAELEGLQPGWQVELRRKGEGAILDAVFFDPEGVLYRSFAEARREALSRAKGKGSAK